MTLASPLLGFYYLGQPYYDPSPLIRDDRAWAAGIALHAFLSLRVPVYAPIVAGHSIVTTRPPHIPVLPPSHAFWLGLDEHFLKTSQGLLVLALPGWSDSKGLKQEIHWHREIFNTNPLLIQPRLEPRDLTNRGQKTIDQIQNAVWGIATNHGLAKFADLAP